MSYRVSAIVAGTRYELDDQLVYTVLDDDGLGAPPLHRITERGPLQHGESDVGFRLDPRTLQLKLVLRAGDASSFWAARRQLLRIFKPRLEPIQLCFEFDDGTVRQIDVHYAGELSLRGQDRVATAAQLALVRLVAPDPTFYDPTPQAVVYGVGGGSSTGLQFPSSFPWSFGSSTIDATRDVSYAGDWASFPIIEIVGPITSPVIANLTTGDKLDLTGTTIAAGERYLIDCRYGYKTVTDGNGVNRIAQLSDDSDLATFRLEADPEAQGGVNTIRVQGSNATGATEIYIRYYNRYLGI